MRRRRRPDLGGLTTGHLRQAASLLYDTSDQRRPDPYPDPAALALLRGGLIRAADTLDRRLTRRRHPTGLALLEAAGLLLHVARHAEGITRTDTAALEHAVTVLARTGRADATRTAWRAEVDRRRPPITRGRAVTHLLRRDLAAERSWSTRP